MSDSENDQIMDTISSESSTPPTSFRSASALDQSTPSSKSHAIKPHRVGSFPNLTTESIELFFTKKGDSSTDTNVTGFVPSTTVASKSIDVASEASLRKLLQQAQTLLSRLGDVCGAIHTFQLILTFLKAAGNGFSLDLILDVLKFLKPLTKALHTQPLTAVSLLEQANSIAERFGFVEYQIKFSLQMPLILLPEMDLNRDDTMKQLRRAVQECAGAHLLITKYLVRLQSPSHTPQRQDNALTSKIEKLSIKLNALLSTVEKMFLVYTATRVSFHPHILQTVNADIIFHHYACLELLALHLLKRGDYERARSLFPSKLQTHLINHNLIYGHSLLKINSEINELECHLNGVSATLTPADSPAVLGREARSDEAMMLDILNELEQDQLEQSTEGVKAPLANALSAVTPEIQKKASLRRSLKSDNYEASLFMQYRRAFTAIRRQIPSNLLVADDQGNLDTNLVNRVQLKLTKGVREIITSIIDQVLDLAGPPPCKFCILGLGSHGRTEVAPYSDFEFALLLEKDMQDEGDEDSFVSSYFGRFVEMMDFLVNCIGEPTGFRLDTQGTPKEYRFRGTPAQIVDRAFKNLDAQGIPMAFSLLQPVCVYVGGPPKSIHLQASSASGLPYDSLASPRTPHSYAQLASSTPSIGNRANTMQNLSSSSDIPSSLSASTSPSGEVRKASSTSQFRRPPSHSKATPPAMNPSLQISYPAASSNATSSSANSGSSVTKAPVTESGYSTSSDYTITSPVPLISLPDLTESSSESSQNASNMPTDGGSPIRRPSSTSSTSSADLTSHEAYNLFATYQDLVISRLQHDTWKGQFLHASLAKYCLADHLRMLVPGRKWHRPLDKSNEVHLKDHFLTPLICFTHDIALYYLSHIPTVFPTDASATSHLMDSLAVSNARTPHPVIANAYAAAFREAWAALNAIRIRAELEYGEQIDAETPVYLDAKTAPPHGVVLLPMERYWLKFTEWVVLKPLYRVLPTFLESMLAAPAAEGRSSTGERGAAAKSGRPPSGSSNLNSSRRGTPHRSSVGTSSYPIHFNNAETPGSSNATSETGNSTGSANGSAIPFSNSISIPASASQAASPFSSAMASTPGTPIASSTSSGVPVGSSPVVGRARSGSDAGLPSPSSTATNHSHHPPHTATSGPNVVAHESDIETMDPAIHCIEQLLELHRSGAQVNDWQEPVISLAWTLTLRHSAPRVHLTYYRLFPPEWRSTYYLTLEQLEIVHAPLLDNVFDEICSYADPSGSRLHSKPVDSLWRDQVNTEVAERWEAALLASLEANPKVKPQKIRQNQASTSSATATTSSSSTSATTTSNGSPISSPTPSRPSIDNTSTVNPPGVVITPLSPSVSHQWLPSNPNSSQSIVVVASPSPEPDPSAKRTPSPYSPYKTPSRLTALPDILPTWNGRKLEGVQPKRLDGRVVETEAMIFLFPHNLLSSISEVLASLFYRRIVFKGSAHMSIARVPIRRAIRDQLDKRAPLHPPTDQNITPAEPSPRDQESSIGSARKRGGVEGSDSRSTPERRPPTERKKLITASMVVQRVQGETLKSVLESDPDQLSKLDRQSFSDSFLASLLMIGIERFAEDVILQPYLAIDKENVQSEAYRLVVSRHASAWGECAQMASSPDATTGQLGAAAKQIKPVRNILFCLDLMNEPVNPDSLFQFLDLDPIMVLTSWVKELKQTQQRWSMRFGQNDVKRLFQPAALQSIGSGQLDILGVQDHVIPRLLNLMHKIQVTLRANTKRTQLEILKLIHPVLGHVYGNAHRNTSLKSPQERLVEASKPILVSSIYRLLPRSSDIQNFVPKAKVVLLSVTELRAQLTTYMKENSMLADARGLVMDSYNRGSWELFHFNPHLQQRVLEALDSKELPLNVQLALLSLVEQANQRLNEVTIRNSDALDNAMLESLVRQCGPMITKLHLPGCQKMENRFIGGSDVIKLLADHCPGLTSLDLSGTNIKYFAVQQLTRTAEIKFERLEWLFLDNCRQLEKVKLLTPALWHVDARHCSELVKLEANTKGATWATADLFGSKVVCTKLLMLVGLSLSKPISYMSVNSRRFQDMIEPLEQLLADPTKTRYEVSHRTIPADLITLLSTVISYSSLSEIIFNSCELEDESIRNLADACFASRKNSTLTIPTIHSNGKVAPERTDATANETTSASPKMKLSIVHCRVPPPIQQEILGKALGTSVFVSFSEKSHSENT